MEQVSPPVGKEQVEEEEKSTSEGFEKTPLQFEKKEVQFERKEEPISGDTLTPPPMLRYAPERNASVSSFSSYSETDTEIETDGQGTPAQKNFATGSRKLTETDREFFMRIEKEWRAEDAWSNKPGSAWSTLLWMPILIVLRIINLWMTVIFWPIQMIVGALFGMKMKKITFWDVPLERRKQTAVVALFVGLLPCCFMAYIWSLVLLVFPLTTVPMLAYYLWIFYWDKSAEDGSRKPFARYWQMWRHFGNYFPLRLIKTSNLNPSGKYVFCYHPHGIISVGAFGNFATDATGFSRKFPGIDLRVLTLEMNFWCPWLRELLLSLGICSASKKSCNQILSKGPGSSILLVVGGAAESLDTQPGTYRMTLGRKGFVRVALDNGADLVPVLAFGENDVFDTMYFPPNSWSRKIQEYVRKKLGFATPVFFGRGIFNYSAGILPHRRPVIVVVGKPIRLPRLPEHLTGSKLSTTEEGRALVNKYHEKYIRELRKLWDVYKHRWAVQRKGSLVVNLDK
eukprot:CAMPEP_0203760300 /NCGR_PEP_ID=MMETSP0098-20131031/13625_1 /ASSEMBLY_ACC=CAM_ASM_000208 /TAXON_ID=96639 /ORGANISM=" , Strain NY0313808BC1" /LENGTH=510 /DNA_ID=CAMNT_0050653811 /DNA_START=1985 /DNA_END=3517 /DNA_ORIENTATION=-